MVSTGGNDTFWYLEGFVDSRRGTWRTVIRTLPTLIGRHPEADLQLFSDCASSRHAELFERDGRLWIRDLDSTNGTRLNFERLHGEAELTEGDVLHFGDLEFRLSVYRPASRVETRHTHVIPPQELSREISLRGGGLTALMAEGAVLPFFQPVVDLHSRNVAGYELLSRGALDGFVRAPAELFSIAEDLGLEVELSQLFRESGIRVFLNTHPAELNEPDELLDSLRAIREDWATARLVIEIHETATTRLSSMRELREELRRLDIGLAFDDFGTGRSRLMEISEAPPDYLKFDMAFIRDIDLAPGRRRQVLLSLVEMTRSLGIAPIAEGVERRDEAIACLEVGFSFAQGYFLGIPRPISDNRNAA
jgi:EAL domain-containing protein (putative c-di-GMP-specific phosphodiesterase class I)